MRSLFAVVLVAACSKGQPPPVAPGDPIYAGAEVQLASMKAECDGLITAFETWKQCPNAEDDQKESIDDWIEVTKEDFAAGEKANLDERGQHEIAVRCRRAADSVRAAAERCSNGKRPKRE